MVIPVDPRSYQETCKIRRKDLRDGIDTKAIASTPWGNFELRCPADKEAQQKDNDIFSALFEGTEDWENINKYAEDLVAAVKDLFKDGKIPTIKEIHELVKAQENFSDQGNIFALAIHHFVQNGMILNAARLVQYAAKYLHHDTHENSYYYVAALRQMGFAEESHKDYESPEDRERRLRNARPDVFILLKDK
jgi:hypothetical protein